MSKNGGSAFPVNQQDDRNGDAFIYADPGMTLRDYFAAKAMAAMISTAAAPCMGGLDGYEVYNAKAAYKIADAMLKAREVGE